MYLKKLGKDIVVISNTIITFFKTGCKSQYPKLKD